MKSTVYVETSVISYLTSRPSRDVIIAGRQLITNDWWNKHRDKFDLYISELVIEEINHGDSFAAKKRMNKVANIPSLAITNESIKLAKLLLSHKLVPLGSKEDALHIAVATLQGIDYLLTWNFKHINNAEMRASIVRIIESCSYICPHFCSPEELGGTVDV